MATTTKVLARTAAAKVSIAENSVFSFDLKQVPAATKIIAGLSSVTTTTFHISGVEIA
jgi:hypothetical protein